MNNIQIKVSDRKQQELINKAEDFVDTVKFDSFNNQKIKKRFKKKENDF